MWNQNNPPNTPTTPPPAPTKPAMSSSPASAASEFSSGRTPLGGSPASTDHAAAIGKSLVIKGEVTGSESLYIDGKVEGSINLPGNRVTVGRNGQASATITAREVIVQGKILGNVHASERLDVRNEGSLTGDVVAQRISVEDGAFVKGKIDIQRPGQSGEKISSGSETKEPAISAEQPVKIA